jgi:glycosyltransferase involved in cell wall biosynthesis
MRILVLHQHFSTPAGTTGTRSHALGRALAARGHEVTIACGSYAGAETGLCARFRRGRREGRVGPLRVVEFDIPCGNAQGLMARGAAFLRYAAAATLGPALAGDAQGRPWDLILASSTPLTVALPALVAQARRGTPFVFEIRDPWPELPRAMGGVPAPMLAGMEWLANAACRRAAAVIALSDGMAETARARGADPSRIAVVPNGCDLDLFGPHIEPWRPAEAGSEEVLATYAGAHGKANGLHQLLDAAALLQARPGPGPRLRFVLVGEGSEKSALQARARAEGLANVIFLDPLPKPVLASLLAGSQIALHCLAPVPAFAEWTSPNKLMDYLAAGLAVVSNQPGAAARLLEEGRCGVTVPPGDAPALAAALARLAANQGRRQGLGAAARSLAVRRWDRRLLAARFCETLEAAALGRPLAASAPPLPAAA